MDEIRTGAIPSCQCQTKIKGLEEWIKGLVRLMRNHLALERSNTAHRKVLYDSRRNVEKELDAFEQKYGGHK